MTVLYSLVAAAVGAAVGAFATHLLQRARPRILIDTISVVPHHSKKRTPAAVNSILKNRLDSYDNPVGMDRLDVTVAVSERSYVGAFREAKYRLSNDIEITIPLFIELVEKFRTSVVSRRLEEAYDTFATESYGIWHFLAMSCIRGDISSRFLRINYEALDLTRKHSVIQADGILAIALPGAYNISIPYGSGPPAHSDRLEELAQRVMKAFSYEYEPALLEIADRILTGARRRLESAKELLVSVEGELEPHNRIIVEGMISNGGGSAFSLSNRSKMVIQMKGYRYSRNGKAAIIPDDVDIDIELGARVSVSDVSLQADPDDLGIEVERHESPADFSSPLIIEGGQSRRFICRSDLPLNSMPNWQELIDAFHGGDRKCYMALGLLTSGGAAKPIYSPRLLFRDLLQAQDLPRRRR